MKPDMFVEGFVCLFFFMKINLIWYISSWNLFYDDVFFRKT